MKFFVIIICFLSFSNYAANGYKLNLNVLFAGQKASTLKMIVKEGQKALITKEDGNTTIEVFVIAKEGEIQGHKGVLLDLEISHKIGDERTIVAKPQVLVLDGKEAVFETGDNESGNLMSLKIKAHKISL